MTLVEGIDPILAKGSGHTAVAPVTVTPSGLGCSGELWLTIIKGEDIGVHWKTKKGVV